MKNRLASTFSAIIMGIGLTATAAACTTPIASADVGACLNIDDMGTTEITEIPTLDCGTEHDAQVVGKFNLSQDGDFPGTEGMRTEAEDGCLASFSDFVGTPFEESTLNMTYISPSQESWDSGDREILCVAYVDDGTLASESWEGAGL